MLEPRLDAAPLSCPTLTASVSALPAATLVIWRRLAPDPTDTSPLEFCNAARPNAV